MPPPPPGPVQPTAQELARQQEIDRELAGLRADSADLLKIEERRWERALRLSDRGVSLRVIAKAFAAGLPEGQPRISPETVRRTIAQMRA
jgi:hypothetical protein